MIIIIIVSGKFLYSYYIWYNMQTKILKEKYYFI
jgi:hypothetical protein